MDNNKFFHVLRAIKPIILILCDQRQSWQSKNPSFLIFYLVLFSNLKEVCYWAVLTASWTEKVQSIDTLLMDERGKGEKSWVKNRIHWSFDDLRSGLPIEIHFVANNQREVLPTEAPEFNKIVENEDWNRNRWEFISPLTPGHPETSINWRDWRLAEISYRDDVYNRG